MSTIIYHKHHIIPKHAGGTDHPDNIARLTVAEHAEAHRLLYEKYGRWQDKKAYEGLTGFKGKEQIIKEIAHLTGKMSKGRIPSTETRKKISETLKGHTVSPETRAKLSEASKGREPGNKGMKFGPLSPEHKKKVSEALKGHKKSPRTAEHTKNFTASRAGYRHSEETRKRMTEAQQKRRAKEKAK